MALYIIIHVGAFLSRYIPRRWRYFIGAAIGDAVYLAWSRKRRVLRQNMAIVLGRDVNDPEVARIARTSMRNYLKYLVEFLELPVLSPADERIASMKIHGIEYLHEALERGKGVILATAHFGTIEVGALRLSRITDFHAVYDTFRPAYLDRLIQRKRREKGIGLIPVSNVRAMFRVLHDGGTLTLLFDRPLPSDKGVPVRFFGRETSLPAGPATLALRTGATIVPAYMMRRPDASFEGVLFPPVEFSCTGDRERDTAVIMQKLADTLQTMVRSKPEQWYMFRPMWQDGGADQLMGMAHPAGGSPI